MIKNTNFVNHVSRARLQRGSSRGSYVALPGTVGVVDAQNSDSVLVLLDNVGRDQNHFTGNWVDFKTSHKIEPKDPTYGPPT